MFNSYDLQKNWIILATNYGYFYKLMSTFMNSNHITSQNVYKWKWQLT